MDYCAVTSTNAPRKYPVLNIKHPCVIRVVLEVPSYIFKHLPIEGLLHNYVIKTEC